MSGEVIVRNSLLVEGTRAGRIRAKATRADVNTSWFVGRWDDRADRWLIVAEVHSWVPEVLGRKLVLALVKELTEQEEE